MLKRAVAVVVLVVLAVVCSVPVWACDPPYVGVNSPGDGATVSGVMNIEVNVTSETEVKGVDVYLDKKLVASLPEAPYVLLLDTTKLAKDAHELYVKARAIDREDGISPIRKFTVSGSAEVAQADSPSATASTEDPNQS